MDYKILPRELEEALIECRRQHPEEKLEEEQLGRAIYRLAHLKGMLPLPPPVPITTRAAEAVAPLAAEPPAKPNWLLAAWRILLLIGVAILCAQAARCELKPDPRVARIRAIMLMHGGLFPQPGGPTVARLQVRSGANIWTDVGFFAGNLNIPVNCVAGCVAGGSFVDSTAFTFGVTAIGNMGAVVDDVATNTVAENSAGAPRMNTNRILYFNPRNNAGTELGTTANPFGIRGVGAVVADSTAVRCVNAANTAFESCAGAGGAGGTSSTDQAAFAAGVTPGTPTMGARDDTAPSTLAEDTLGITRMTQNRALHTNLRNDGGTEIGTATTPVRTDPTGTTIQPVSGTVTANQGGAPWSTTSNKSTNAGVPGATNLGVLPCLANAAAPTLTETFQVTLSCDLAGNIRVVTPGTVTVAGTVTANQGGAPWSFVGTKSNNAGAPGATNLGTLPGVATAALPAYTEGNQVGASVNLRGTLRTDAGLPSTGNSTTTALGISATFTGTFEEVTDYAGLTVIVFANVASATDGLCFDWSPDGTNADRSECSTVNASAGRAFNLSVRAQFFRVRYINGGTAQTTFRLDTIYCASCGGVITKPLDGTVTDENFAQSVQSATMGRQASGTYINVGADSSAELFVAGGVASGVADAGAPVKIGTVARNANPTAAANGNRMDAYGDLAGRLVVTDSPRELVSRSNVVTVSTTTETTLLTAGGAGVFLDVYFLVCSNTSATAVRVDVRDATAGTIRFPLFLPASDMRGATIPSPALAQTTANSNWTIQLGAAVTDVRCSAYAYAK